LLDGGTIHIVCSGYCAGAETPAVMHITIRHDRTKAHRDEAGDQETAPVRGTQAGAAESGRACEEEPAAVHLGTVGNRVGFLIHAARSPSPSAHLQLFMLDFSQDHRQPSRPRKNGSFGAAHPATDCSYAESRERQLPQPIIVGVCPWSRGEARGI
jgi:hypothetical protein